MRVRGVSATILAMLLVTTGLLPATAAPSGADGVWIVTLGDDHPAAEHADALVQRNGGELRHVYSHALNGFSFRGSEQAARNLERNPRVTRVEADQPVQATEAVPSGVARIDAPAAHSSGYVGTGVKVAIIDTGIDASHPALTVDTSLGVNCIEDGGTDDGNGHGTHVAGTTSASIDDGDFVGAATDAQVVPVKVLGDDGSGSWATVICGVDHVTGNAQQLSVANMSLGGSGEAGDSCGASSLRQAICSSVDAGVTYTVAAGNDASDASGFVPAAYPEVITVSALDEERSVRVTGGGPPRTESGDGLASFSNHGESVDVIAPGVGINSTVPGGGYAAKSGTSMAAPHVAGVAALMLAANGELTPAQVRATLQSTGECPDDGTENAASSGACQDQGQWLGDPDGIAEPLINAPRAAAAAGDPQDPVYDEPLADFAYDCTDLECTFTNQSTIDDGLEATYDWDFDDGTTSTEENPAHTYASANTYTVSLTVTDSQGRSDQTAQEVSVTAPDDGTGDDPAAGIALEVDGYKVRGLHKADLSWSGNDAYVDILRDGTEVKASVSGSTYTDHINQRGSATYTYQVCETGSSDACSDEVTIEF